MWVISKVKDTSFRVVELKSGGEHEDCFASLLESTLKNIRAVVDVTCENRSLEEQIVDATASTGNDDQGLVPLHKTFNYFQPLYDAVIRPIEDFLDGDELIVVPDGALSFAPWAALSESLRIRTVPSLTCFKLNIDSPDDYHCKSGALLVGHPCVKKVTDKWNNPIYNELPFAKKEVEMIGEILNVQPLTGEAATKKQVTLQRMEAKRLVKLLWLQKQMQPKNPMRKDHMLKMSDVQAINLRARLVVLSCRHSGEGEVSSEGVVGMARAFLFAGARSVQATLWAVDDEATQVFMKSFYQHL